MDKELKKIEEILATPVFPTKIELGKRYKFLHDVSSMDTWYMMKIVNDFLQQTGKQNVQVEVSNIGKPLPKMNEKLPYIVIETSAKGILRGKKNLAKRNYVTILEDDYTESDKLAMMVISIL